MVVVVVVLAIMEAVVEQVGVRHVVVVQEVQQNLLQVLTHTEH